jgi:hypothetical protein
MNPPMIGFLSGVVVGGAGAIFLIGLLFLCGNPENEKIIQKIENGLDRASIAKSINKRSHGLLEERSASLRELPDQLV